MNPLSIAAHKAAYEHGGPWLEQLKAYVDGNLALVDRFLKENIPGAKFTIPESTYFAWVDLREVLPEVEDLPDFFASKAGVLLEGGDGLFVGNARGHIRLNLAMPRATVQTGLERIAEAIRKEKPAHNAAAARIGVAHLLPICYNGGSVLCGRKTPMKKTLDSNAIKLVAIAAMTVDHVAWWLFPGYPRAVLPLAMHIIGRLTCPIMCYFVAEGYHHTRDIRKYTARMFLFAVISHFAYVFASADFAGWRSFIPFSSGRVLNQTSVMWSLAWGLVMLRVVHDRRLRPAVQVALILLICLVSFPADWSCIAALCIMAFGTNRGKLKTQTLWMMFYVALYAVVYALALDWVYGLVQLAVVLAVPVLALYNGQRGPSPRVNTVMKWLFYLYYPAHLALIGWLQMQ